MNVPDSAAARAPCVAIKPVGTRRELRAFLRLPWQIYQGDPCWVPPLLAEQKRLLDRRANPFFHHAEIQLFLAQRSGRHCGRIAAIIDRSHNETHDERTGFFGFFECVDDLQVARALLDAARSWIAQRGMDRIRGPISPSTNHECGLLVDGFDSPPMLMMPYNPTYYEGLLQRLGLEKARDLYAYWLDRNVDMPEKVYRVAERARQRLGVTIRSAVLGDFKAETERIRRIYNEAWKPNWGFVPLSKEEFEFLAAGFRAIVVPEFVLLAEVAERPVGFLLALPDINRVLKSSNGRLFPLTLFKLLWSRRRIRHLRIPIMGVVPAMQNRGVAPMLYLELMMRGLAQGYEAIEISWVLEDNATMNRAADLLGARRYKTYRIYEDSVKSDD